MHEHQIMSVFLFRITNTHVHKLTKVKYEDSRDTVVLFYFARSLFKAISLKELTQVQYIANIRKRCAVRNMTSQAKVIEKRIL